MREIVYSSKPITLREHILLQSIQGPGDFRAVLELFVRRTDLTETEAMDLDGEDIGDVLKEIVHRMSQAAILQQLGKSLEPEL